MAEMRGPCADVDPVMVSCVDFDRSAHVSFRPFDVTLPVIIAVFIFSLNVGDERGINE